MTSQIDSMSVLYQSERWTSLVQLLSGLVIFAPATGLAFFSSATPLSPPFTPLSLFLLFINTQYILWLTVLLQTYVLEDMRDVVKLNVKS